MSTNMSQEWDTSCSESSSSLLKSAQHSQENVASSSTHGTGYKQPDLPTVDESGTTGGVLGKEGVQVGISPLTLRKTQPSYIHQRHKAALNDEADAAITQGTESNSKNRSGASFTRSQYGSPATRNIYAPATNSSFTAATSMTSGTSGFLIHGMNMTNDGARRLERMERAHKHATFRQHFFVYAWLIVFPITVGFYLPLILRLNKNDRMSVECRPEFALSVVLVSVCGGINTLLMFVYAVLVWRKRQHEIFIEKGNLYVKQILVTCVLSPIFITLDSLGYFGALTGECNHMYDVYYFVDQDWGDNLWSHKSIAIYVTIMCLSSYISLSLMVAVLGRLNVQYKLHVSRDAATVYTRKQLLWFYNIFNLVFTICYAVMLIIIHIFLWAYVSALAVEDKSEHASRLYYTVHLLIVIYKGSGTVLLIAFFVFYCYKTWSIDEIYHDRWSYVRYAVLLFGMAIPGLVLDSMISHQYDFLTKMIVNCSMLFNCSVLMMDTFTAAIWMVYKGPHLPDLPHQRIRSIQMHTHHQEPDTELELDIAHSTTINDQPKSITTN